MLDMVGKLRRLGIGQLCALRLAIWSVSRQKPEGSCACRPKPTCDEMARLHFSNERNGT